MNRIAIVLAGVMTIAGVAVMMRYFESAPAIVEDTHTTSVRPYGRTVTTAEPLQQSVEGISAFQRGEYRIRPLAAFDVQARVLSRRRYRFSRTARLSPVDLSLGWGQMSDERILEHIDISQGNRWYYWKSRSMPIPKQQIQRQSANMHMIPANDEVRVALLKARENDVVSFSGYLVHVASSDGFRWTSSTTRDDVGARSCEVVWVNEFEVIDG